MQGHPEFYEPKPSPFRKGLRQGLIGSLLALSALLFFALGQIAEAKGGGAETDATLFYILAAGSFAGFALLTVVADLFDSALPHPREMWGELAGYGSMWGAGLFGLWLFGQ